MISWKSLYHVLSNVIPLYVVMILAYGSVKWWKLFSPSECLGINRFVVLFAAPLLSIKYISNNNPYTMNFHFIAADTLQKVIVIIILFLWHKLTSIKGSFEWCITLFSLTTLNNTLVMGIPLLGGMYGDTPSKSLMVQLSVVQFIVWYPSLLLLFEYRRAKLLINQKCCPKNEAIVATTTNGDDYSPPQSFRNDGNLEIDEKRDVVVDVDLQNESDHGETDQGGDDKNVADDDHNHDHDYRGICSPVQPIETATQIEPNSTDKLLDGVTSRLILIMVCLKLMKNPNFYSSVIALIWSLISFRYHVNMPAIVANSIKILSDAGLGMAMFSLGKQIFFLFVLLFLAFLSCLVFRTRQS
ncbi:putative auxin efflux carrier component 1c [Bienertia sinuspersici]